LKSKPTAVFLVNLVQDVNILRPLVHMASQDFEFETILLASLKFLGRDQAGIWREELSCMCAAWGCRLEFYESEKDALKWLDGKDGLIFAGSESNLPAHSTTHALFLCAPPSFLRVTLQHGLECVGFRHSVQHAIAHGSTVSFGADIICGWMPAKSLSALNPSQQAKLLVTGPSAILQQPSGPVERKTDAPGLVCENLHSVRLNVSGDLKSEFVDSFGRFCRLLERERRKVVLRPHPGGQYVLKNNVPLPSNASIENSPLYRVDLRNYAFGISAPSSVLLDMLLAGIPTAVWGDSCGTMDASIFDGLTKVSTPDEWLSFSQKAVHNPQPFLERQESFLTELGVLREPQEVYRQFARLFASARRSHEYHHLRKRQAARERILFVANSYVPTLQLSFVNPMAAMVENGSFATKFVFENDVAEAARKDVQAGIATYFRTCLTEFTPTMIIFCRYSGQGSDAMMAVAKELGISTIYHIDDDLLSIPEDIGQKKFEHHNAPARINSVRYLIENSDVTYVSTERLRITLAGKVSAKNMVAGEIYCSGSVMRAAVLGQTRKVGYMASADHAHNLQMILPAIELYLDRNPDVQFELFGSIPVPEGLKKFGPRITVAPPISNYNRFLEEFSSYGWDIGICPLTPIPFNLSKANTKWVEYTSVGIAAIASKDTVYDDCCDNGCGILATTNEDWLNALERLTRDPHERFNQVIRAQQKLRSEYGLPQLRRQVLDMMALARQG
jgi:hypothetical protein